MNPKNLRIGQLFTVNDSEFPWHGSIFRLVSRTADLLYVDEFSRGANKWSAFHKPVDLNYKINRQNADKSKGQLILRRLSKNVLNIPTSK